jgi:hypothetical protein
MMDERLEELDNKIRLYMAAWLWHLMAIVFLNSLIILLVLGKYPYVGGLTGVIIFCEYMAFRRKEERIAISEETTSEKEGEDE